MTFPDRSNPLIDMVREALITRDRIEVAKERRWQVKRFLSQADALLAGYDTEAPEITTRGRERLTSPVEFVMDGRLLQAQVVRAIVNDQFIGYSSEVRWTGIRVTDPVIGENYDLFGVEQHLLAPDQGRARRTSRARNYLGGIASNVEVLKGLKAMNFIADELSYQPMWNSLNR